MAEPTTNEDKSGQNLYRPSADTGKKGFGAKTTSFLKRNKKGVGIGVGVGGGLVGVVITIFMALSGTQLVWMNQIMQGFNYDPYNRNVIRRVVNVKQAFTAPAQTQSRSQLGQKIQTAAATGDRASRIAVIEPETLSRYNRRVNHRFTIGNNINTIRARYQKPPFNWRVFSGQSPAVAGAPSPRLRLLGIDETREPYRTGRTNLDAAVDDARQQTPSERRGVLRRAANQSAITTATAVSTLVCLSAVYSDMIPDDDEMYELFLSYAAGFNTAGSQLSTGEDVHGDELAEVMELYYDQVEVEYDDTRDEDITWVGNRSGDQFFEEGEEGETTLITNRDSLDGDSDQRGVSSRERSFTDSAAWKRANNLPLTGNEEDSQLSYNYLSDELGTWSSVANTVGGGANVLFLGNASLVCSAAGAVSVPLVLAEIVGTYKTAGLWQAARKATFHASMVGGIVYLMEQISFDSVIPDGPEMQMGVTDLGMNLTQSEFARSQGAPPLTNQQANSVRSEHFQQLALEDRERGLKWRYLSLENPRSALAQLAMTSQKADISPRGTLRALAGVPSRLLASLTNLFSVHAADHAEFDNYGIQQYGFTDADLTHDPLENAEYVEGRFACAQNPNATGCTETMVQEGELMQEILSRCIDTNSKYYELDEFCKSAEDKRGAWVRIGLWRLDNDIVDGLECLSHNQSCPRSTPASPAPADSPASPDPSPPSQPEPSPPSQPDPPGEEWEII